MCYNILVYIPNVQIHGEKSNFQEKSFSMLLWETKELLRMNLTVYFHSTGLLVLAEGIVNFDIM